MELAARIGTMARSGAPLLYDAEVDYLESTGTQYIDTGIIPIIGYTYNMRFQSSGIVEYGYLFGVNWRDDAGAVEFFGLRRSQTQARFQSLGLSVGTVPYEEGIDYDITINGGEVGSLNEFRLSDGRVFSHNSKINVSPRLPMNLLAVNNNGGVAYQNKVLLYSFSIESNGESILDLIPIRKGNIGYMYDRVSGQLFGNAGRGAFLIGPDKTT